MAAFRPTPLTWLLILLGLVVLALGTTWLQTALRTEEPVMAQETSALLFETPAWQTPGDLLVRREHPDAPTLLLKHSEREGLYRFDPEAQSLSPVDPQAWERADGPIGNCGRWLAQSPEAFHTDPETGLSFGDRPLATTGATVLALVAAPSQNKVAVLSAEGPANRSPLPFLSGGGASGQHHLQVFSLPGLVLLDASVPLPMGARKETIAPCWSPGERFLLFTNFAFTRLSIVSLEAETE